MFRKLQTKLMGSTLLLASGGGLAIVKQITNNQIIYNTNLQKGKKLNYDMLIWTGGIKPHDLTLKIMQKLKHDTKNGIKVNNILQIVGTNNTYALGDCTKTNNPPTAQVAYQQGEYLAKEFNKNSNLQERTNKEFIFKDNGKLVYIGFDKAIYEKNNIINIGYLINIFQHMVHIYNQINIYKSLELLYEYIKK